MPGQRDERDQPVKDPEDEQFGATAERDAEKVDRMAAGGADEENMPEVPGNAPRPGTKAEPDRR